MIADIFSLAKKMCPWCFLIRFQFFEGFSESLSYYALEYN